MSPSPCSFMTALDESFALTVSLPIISCSTSTSLLFSRVRNPFLTQPYNVDVITERVQCDPPPPVIHNGVEEYEVEHILDSQIFLGKLEYLVCWKGYGIEGDEWRP